MSALTKVVSLSQILFGTDYAGLGAEAGQQGERVFAVDLLQLLSAKHATFLQSLDVIRKGARGVIGAEEDLRQRDNLGQRGHRRRIGHLHRVVVCADLRLDEEELRVTRGDVNAWSCRRSEAQISELAFRCPLRRCRGFRASLWR